MKHQGMNPTGSFKDTGISAAITMAKAEGFSWVCCASTGNTSASVAAYAARAEMKSIVLLPAGQVAAGKLAQALEYGANVLQLRTDFDGCLRVLHEVVRKFSAYLLNSLNPYRIEGQKTVAFELMEQLDWRVPEHVIVPGGNLGNSSALGKGFMELRDLGLIHSLPKISIIQASGANPLVRTMRENGGTELVRVTPETQRNRYSDWQSRFLAKSGDRAQEHRRRVRRGQRERNCSSQSRAGRGRNWLRTGIGSDSGWT